MSSIIVGVAVGGFLGFLFGYFGKCASGTCPITSNPMVSTVIGVVLGVLFVTGK